MASREILLSQGRGFVYIGDPFVSFHIYSMYGSAVNLRNHTENQEKITGICTSPSISHLLFVVNSLFFCKAKPHEYEKVMRVVRKYGKSLGQCINFDKSILLFGKRIPENVRQ